MPKLDDYQKKRLALWASVGGTMAVIVALWAFVLPQQLGKLASHSGDGSLTRWMSVRQSAVDPGEQSQTFSEMLQKQRDRLNAVAQNQRDVGNTGNNVNIDALDRKSTRLNSSH